jgi:curved DNA-binding protein
MAANFRDYYATLGVARTATGDEIKTAFRKLARRYHPDVAKDKKEGEAKFKEINEAYEVLGDPEKRKKYDQLGANWDRPAPPPGYAYEGPETSGAAPGEDFHFEGTGFSDFFEQFFGAGRGMGGFGASARATASGPRHGRDVEGAILVTLEEVMNGSLRQISFQSTDPATGTAKTESFKVRIPKGALDGQVIRVPGKGEAGANGGEPGHLFLRVRLAADPDFRVLGADLYRDLALAPWEAVLGATVRLRGLDGEFELKVPAGSTNGRKLRLRGRGLAKPKSEERGDLYVEIQIQIPTQLSPEEKSLWEQLQQKSSFAARN